MPQLRVAYAGCCELCFKRPQPRSCRMHEDRIPEPNSTTGARGRTITCCWKETRVSLRSGHEKYAMLQENSHQMASINYLVAAPLLR